MIKEAIAQLVKGVSLSQDQSAEVMAEIMRDEATAAQMAGFLIALRMKGESPEEVAGLARTMRTLATPIDLAGPLLDTCGTGGDDKGSFNISTAAAVVAAAAGIKVAKHGNRGASSRCGSADVLEALGVHVSMNPEQVASCIATTGIGFLFAPVFHPSMRYTAGPRRELGVRTVFNLLGPLANPAGVRRQVVGVARSEHVDLIAQALLQLGVDHALVVHGAGGADELTLAGENDVCEVRDGGIRSFRLHAAALGLGESGLEPLRGGDAQENARILIEVLDGATGPRRDVVLLNAAATIYVAGLAPSIEAALPLAARSIDSGAARGKLQALAQFTQADLAG